MITGWHPDLYLECMLDNTVITPFQILLPQRLEIVSLTVAATPGCPITYSTMSVCTVRVYVSK